MQIRWSPLPYHEPFEYWCNDCKELNLSFLKTDKCIKCGSTNILKGKVGTLNLVVITQENKKIKKEIKKKKNKRKKRYD